MVLVMAPFVLLICFVLGLGVEVPYFDQWQFLPLMDEVQRGELEISGLWSQHNDHRLVFPRLLMLGLISQWNTHLEKLASIGFASGLLAWPLGVLLLIGSTGTRRAKD